MKSRKYDFFIPSPPLSCSYYRKDAETFISFFYVLNLYHFLPISIHYLQCKMFPQTTSFKKLLKHFFQPFFFFFVWKEENTHENSQNIF